MLNCKIVSVVNKKYSKIASLILDMGILLHKILLRHHDNENIFVATITTKKTIMTIGKILSKEPPNKGSITGK